MAKHANKIFCLLLILVFFVPSASAVAGKNDRSDNVRKANSGKFFMTIFAGI